MVLLFYYSITVALSLSATDRLFNLQIAMKPSIADSISFEVKQEIANRYFGFRKLIEEDKLKLSEQIQQHSFILEKRISFDLIRIYILLHEKEIIDAFLALTGLDEELFYDPYLCESESIRKRVFEGLHLRGITKKGSFKNAVIDCYERLSYHVNLYREKFADLVASHEMISEEIKLFYKQNDLRSIMSFMRSLGEPSPGNHIQPGITTNSIAQSLDQKMQISPPDPIAHFLPVIPPLVPYFTIRKELKKIISHSYSLQKKNVHSYISQKSSIF